MDAYEVLYSYGFRLAQETDLDTLKGKIKHFETVMNHEVFDDLRSFGNVYPENPGEKNIAMAIALACGIRKTGVSL